MDKIQNFNYHGHTYRCGHADLGMHDEDYIKEYINLGIKKIAFTDHAPQKNKIDKRTDMRMDYSQKDEYKKSIEKLKEEYKEKIQIEVGYEIEYLPGEEENIQELKQETDKLIIGQHFIYDDNKNLKIFGEDDFEDKELIRYGKYIEKAMELKIPNIIAHPDIYMYRRKEFGKVEQEVAEIIGKSAEKYQIPLEINLCRIFRNLFAPHKTVINIPEKERQEKLKEITYPCRGFWETVSKYNIKVLYGIDAHYKGQILLFPELIKYANQVIGEETIKKLNFIK